jgi:hypothetical protein
MVAAVAVVPALAGVLKHHTVKTFKLLNYDYRADNFSRYRTTNYLGRPSDPGKFVDAQL